MSHQVPPDVEESSDESDSAPMEGLRKLRRNRFYHGKLMTARDMEVEQDYHARRLESFAGAIAGRGVVTGLETTVTATAETVTARVQRGYALDAAGRPLLVPQVVEATIARHRTTAPGEAASVSVYLSYDTCATQKVPVEGEADACNEECTYNHVVEDVDVELVPGEPDRAQAVDRVDFPTHSSADAAPERGEASLHEIAASHARYRREAADPAGGGERVLLGHFRDEGDDTWTRDESIQADRVYTLDMLYAAIARHTADDGNPHEVVASVGGVRPDDAGDVGVVSTDGTVDVGPGNDGTDVDLSVASLESTVETLATQVSLLKERVADLEEEAGVSRFEPGQLVTDRDDPAPDPAVVLEEVSERADEWIVYQDETVHDHNPEYSAHDQVVIVAFRELLEAGLDDWQSIPPSDLFETVLEAGVKFHAFPEGRLERGAPDSG